MDYCWKCDENCRDYCWHCFKAVKDEDGSIVDLIPTDARCAWEAGEDGNDE